MTGVRGRLPDPGSSRRDHRREWRRESLWLWPAVATVVASVAAILLVDDVGSFFGHTRLFSTNIDDARALLGTIAASILTFTGVVFSITLVALQMASTQFTPRVLRMFVRKPVTKAALTSFIATFVYSLVVLSRLGTSPAVPVTAVGLSFVLVLVSVFVFVVFVHSTVRSMRVTYVISSIHRETLRSIGTTFPSVDRTVEAGPPALVDDPTVIRFEHRGVVLDGIQSARLVHLAREHGCVLRLLVGVGTYVSTGLPVAEAHGGTAPGLRDLLACCDLAPVRTLYQDAAYGVRQLVDIAARALSPAVNDPTTANQALDRLGDLLAAIAGRPDPTPYVVDADHTVRLVTVVPTWQRMLDLSLREIGVYGATDPQVTRRLIAVLDDLAAVVPPERTASVAVHRELLVREVTRLTADEEARRWALTPDRTGAG